MTRRDRLMILAVVGVVLLGGFWFFGLKPQKKAAADAQAALATAQQSLSAAQAKVTSGQQAQAAFRRDRTAILKLGRVVPETDDIPTLLTQLQALAKKEHVTFASYEIAQSSGSSAASGVAATTPAAGASASGGNGSTAVSAPLFPPGSVQVSGGLGRTPISIEIDGTYFQLEKYLQAVQHFAVLSAEHSSTTGRLMIVDSFSYAFAPDEGTTGTKNTELRQPKLTATMSASIYFAPPLQAPSAAAAAASPATGAAGASSTSTGTATIGGLR